MEYRQVTPPSAYDAHEYDAFHCPGGSASTNASYFPQDWSPESMMTAGTSATTPPKSPPKYREIGPTLLPRVRAQDHMMEPSPAHSFASHARHTSLPTNGYPMQLGNLLPVRPRNDRRSTSPLGLDDLATPGSAPLSYEHSLMDPASRRPSMSNARSVSTSNIRSHSHSRNNSSASIDASVLGRYGFPTYRGSPTPQPVPGAGVPMSRTPSAMSHLAPIAMPGGQVQSYPSRRRTASPPANPSRLSVEVDLEAQIDHPPDSSILEYLTMPNPTPTLVQRVVEGTRAQDRYDWYDIRNVRTWTDFNIATISAIPNLLRLLEIGVSSRQLPAPGRVNIFPETTAQVTDICANYHSLKVNAALKLAQGEKHMTMRTLRAAPGVAPDFVSNYQNEGSQTIYGDGRGRVVGVVKCYQQWNSGWRNGNTTEQVNYLRVLALLQRFMREHECRYGFIMTEIELVCVRAGGPPKPDNNVPLFGFVEVAEPVRISTHGRAENGKLQMTVGLALFYLHMLAKEQPLPGQYHWKMDVGPPAQLSRQNHLPRDTWMPIVNKSEARRLKMNRGWTWPDEPLHKRESGRVRRNRN